MASMISVESLQAQKPLPGPQKSEHREQKSWWCWVPWDLVGFKQFLFVCYITVLSL